MLCWRKGSILVQEVTSESMEHDAVWWARLWKRWHYLRCRGCKAWLTRDYVMSELSLCW